MGKAFNALLNRGGSFKASKFKATAGLAVSRSAVLKNQRQARASIARLDAVELLKIGAYERALLRVEQVIKEENMWDAIELLESYCRSLMERVHLIKQERKCPDEVKEAVSSLIFASARIGEFPELLELRSIFVSRYGKEFASMAVELRNECGVNPKIVQKLSTRKPSTEMRNALLKEIAAENGITLPSSSSPPEEERQPKDDGRTAAVDDRDATAARGKYKDVADAAQAAFESAAYAAAAARVAVELSRGDSGGPKQGADGENAGSSDPAVLNVNRRPMSVRTIRPPGW
ncbi:hypothetical protein M569_06903 [Genlisea aurea]|uniref:Uncharacterized protein n=1 Tax=Genlisea aurea TaxID=192259 RepID=S8E682_9LAMI|nr:hypothetical protein M569_06903 [Genlisea aurea]